MRHRESQFSEPRLPLFAFAETVPAPARETSPHTRKRPDRGERLRQRLVDHGGQALDDADLLELVLPCALPRAEARQIAGALLDRFDDFGGAISAPATRLHEIAGIDATVVAALKLVEAAAHRLARARVIHRPVISSWDALLDYCRTTMAHRDTEQFRVLFLDRQNVLIADEEQGRGTVDHVPVYPREVAKRALELNTSALILVHNHPSGDPTPSQSDIDMTEKVQAAIGALDITLHDHLVIGRAREVSFRGAGLL